MVFTGRPLAWTACASPYLSKLSQPSDTSSTAPTFGMGAEPLHHPSRRSVRIAAGKADHVHVAVAERHRDLPRHVVRAFHEVADHDDVADALAPVGAQIARGHDASPARPAPVQMIGRRIVALHVVHVHVRAHGDRRGGRADRRAVLHHLLARGDGAARQLVAERQVHAPPSPARRPRPPSRRRGSTCAPQARCPVRREAGAWGRSCRRPSSGPPRPVRPHWCRKSPGKSTGKSFSPCRWSAAPARMPG